MEAARARRLAAAALVTVCVGLIAGLLWQRSRALSTPGALAARVPSRDAVLLYVDFAALRRAGLLGMLAGSRMAAEPEYRDFVNKTGFDYATDLDAAVISFAPAGKYVVARGRFDWDKLGAYAAQSGGSCLGGFCRVAGSAPERNISWLALARGVLALAVSRDNAAVEILRHPVPGARSLDVPREPVWLSLPPSALRSGADLPPGTRTFARALEGAEELTFSLAAERERFAVKMDVRCRTAGDAAALAQSMERATATLRDFIAREKQAPNPRDLSGVLAAGAFRSESARVRGYWPVERAFFEELFRGAGPS